MIKFSFHWQNGWTLRMFVWKKYNKFVHRNWRIPQCLYFVSTPLLIFILLLLKKIPGKKCPSTRVSFSPLSIFDTASNTARRAALSPHLSKPKYAWCHVWLDPESNIHDTETNVSHRPSTIKGKANLLSNIKGPPHNVSSILTITYSFLALQAEYWPSLFSKKHFLMLHLS